jgi:hypothetical protein
MTLKEIFKNNPELLENEEVKKLISHAETNHNRTVRMNRKLMDTRCSIYDIIMNSELFLIDGTPAKQAIIEIANII